MTEFQHHLFTSAASLATQNILILGLGREGLSTYHFLRSLFPEKTLTLADQKNLAELDPEVIALLHSDTCLDTQLGPEWLNQLNAFDVIFKAPGISAHTHPELLPLQSQFTSNTQLFLQILSHESIKTNFQTITIGITGTKGKSTTTAVIHHVLKQAGKQTLLGGNIGVPPLDLLEKFLEVDPKQPLYLVLELSAHQLESVTTSPQIAVVQNITPEHLDYYPDFKSYLAAKAGITKFQSITDTVICNPSYVTALQVADLSRGEHCYFTASSEQFEDLTSSKQAAVIASISENQLFQFDTPVLDVTQLPLRGQHNNENILPAVALAHLLQIDPTTTATALRSFKGLPHRLEYVETVNDVAFYNDSLATTPEATQRAVAAFPDQPVILLAGGYDRHLDYEALADFILTSSVKALVLFPTTGEYLKKLLEQRAPKNTKKIPLYMAHSMGDAFSYIQKEMKPGDVVLLSPAAASFNLFSDYADRGNQFKHQVKMLT